MGRWGECAVEFFNKKKKDLNPKIEQIHDHEWGQDETRVNENMKKIRQQEGITMLIKEEPEIEAWPAKNIATKTLTMNHASW